MMKISQILSILFLFTVVVATPSLAEEEDLDSRRRIVSPDDRYLLTFIGDTPDLPNAFAVQDLHGAIIFSSKDCEGLKDIITYSPRSVRWSPDSQAVALAAGYPQLLLPYIFIRSGSTFIHVEAPPMESGWDNPYVMPVAWLKNRVLRCKVSGPHAGKASGYSFQGEVRYKVTVKPPKCEKTIENIKVARPPE